MADVEEEDEEGVEGLGMAGDSAWERAWTAALEGVSESTCAADLPAATRLSSEHKPRMRAESLSA